MLGSLAGLSSRARTTYRVLVSSPNSKNEKLREILQGVFLRRNPERLGSLPAKL